MPAQTFNPSRHQVHKDAVTLRKVARTAAAQVAKDIQERSERRQGGDETVYQVGGPGS